MKGYTTDKSIQPLMQEITETVKKTNSIVGTVDETVKGFKEFASGLGEIGSGVKKLGSSLKESEVFVNNIKGQFSGLGAAVKTTFTHFAKGIRKKEEENDEEKSKP